MTAIIGPSGTGKSTLIRCINRLVEPTAGEILFRGQDLVRARRRRELRAARRRIGMVFQEYNLVERLSVIENVLCGRLGYVAVWRAWLRKFPAGRHRPRVRSCSTRSGLADFATQRADQLSGGQRQRVGIARALMQEPDLMLADEPTSSLDPEDLGRDHGADRAPRRRARHPGDRQHPQRRARAALRRPHRRHVEGRDRVRRPAARARGRAPARRSTAAKAGWNERRRPAARAARRLPAELAGADRLRRARRSMSSMPRTILDITWARFVVGLDQGARFLARMFPPDCRAPTSCAALQPA